MEQPAVFPQPGVEFASPERRLAAFVLDIPLFGITLGIGWCIWYLIVAQRGRSPAKQILGIHVVREGGERAGLGRMLLRDLVIRGIGMYALMWVPGTIAPLAFFWVVLGIFAVAALWCAWDANQQCLWDKAVRTYVVRARGGARATLGRVPRASGGPDERRARALERL